MIDTSMFPVTTVGSWPRPPALLKAQREKRKGRLDFKSFNALADESVRHILDIQDKTKVDIVTDGEQRRDNFYSFVAEKLDGVQLMTLGEMLDRIEDKAAFERILQTLDVPSFAVSNATCTGPISLKSSIAADELAFVKQHTDRPVKITLPGPYLLTRSMFVREITSPYYNSKEDLARDVVKILGEEIVALEAGGAAIIQFDEPVLTELVFTQGSTRTFMCAALAARKDPAEELEFAVSLINQVAAYSKKSKLALHVCRGNWSRDEFTLLRGSYTPLKPYFDRMNIDQFVLEYATERAGEIVSLSGKELGLGVVNPRTDEVETVKEIIRNVERAMEIFDPAQISLNPDCGFGTFSSRPMNSTEIAAEKVCAMVKAAQELRSRYG